MSAQSQPCKKFLSLNRVEVAEHRLTTKWILILLAAALIPSACIAWVARDMPAFGLFHDDGIYWVTAKSLAEGREYRITSFPDEPWQTKYPPLYPFLLSLIWRVAPQFPQNLPLAALFGWLLLPVWLALSWLVLRDLGCGRIRALILCGLLALNQTVLLYTTTLMPEILFASLWMASAALAFRARNSLRKAVLAGLLGGTAYLVKTAALPLLVAIPFYLMLRKHGRSAAVFAGAMLPAVAGWNLWSRAHLPASSDSVLLYYTNYLGYQFYNVSWSDLPAVLIKNFGQLLRSLASLISGLGENTIDGLSAGIVWADLAWKLVAMLAIGGVIRHARIVGWNPYHLFAAGHVAMLLLWHFPPNERFLLPLLPLLLAGFSFQLQRMGLPALRFSRPLRNASAAFAVVFACGWCLLLGQQFLVTVPRAHRGFRHIRTEHTSSYRWIAENTPAGARFLAYNDPLLYLYSQRAACRRLVPTHYYYRDDPSGTRELHSSLPEFARAHGLGYLVTTGSDWSAEILPRTMAEEFRRRECQGFPVTEIYRNGWTAVYRFEPEGKISASAPLVR